MASLGSLKHIIKFLFFTKTIIAGHILSFCFLENNCILTLTKLNCEPQITPIMTKFQLNINCIPVFMNIYIQVCGILIMIFNLKPHFQVAKQT